MRNRLGNVLLVVAFLLSWGVILTMIFVVVYYGLDA